MKLSVRKGFSFGLTSGIITTLGLIVGLNSSTHSALIVLGGILVIAVADGLSDAMGMHISEEAENKHKPREVWESTISTFLSKFFFALTFAVPMLLFSLMIAVIISVIWGLFLIGIVSYYIAKLQKVKPYRIIVEHVLIAIIVIIITNFIGSWVALFG